MAAPRISWTETELDGVLLLQSIVAADDRGTFFRTWCAEDFDAIPIDAEFVQSSLSISRRKGILRGLHFQLPPSREGKLVRCVAGSIFDVAVDIRRGSQSFGQAVTATLEADDGRALFIPPGFAHGFQALSDNSAVLYMMTDVHAPELAAGIRWDDPDIGIDWPIAPPEMNERDADYPGLANLDADLDWSANSPRR